jgi:hypothetical protein
MINRLLTLDNIVFTKKEVQTTDLERTKTIFLLEKDEKNNEYVDE